MNAPRPGTMLGAALALWGCASAPGHKFHDKRMDFSSIKTVAVLPFINLSRDNQAAERVRDVFANFLLATGSIYVLPQGEVARGISRAGVANAAAPSKEEAVALGKALAADALITGTVREYGEVRSGTAVGSAVSLSLEMFETTTGAVVWSASSTKGGIGFAERLFGGGGAPMNVITEDACRDLLNKLFH